MKAGTRQINETDERQVSQATERRGIASQNQDRSFARQAYSGNFFAGPHSIFNPMLFKEREELETAAY